MIAPAHTSRSILREKRRSSHLGVLSPRAHSWPFSVGPSRRRRRATGSGTPSRSGGEKKSVGPPLTPPPTAGALPPPPTTWCFRPASRCDPAALVFSHVLLSVRAGGHRSGEEHFWEWSGELGGPHQFYSTAQSCCPGECWVGAVCPLETQALVLIFAPSGPASPARLPPRWESRSRTRPRGVAAGTLWWPRPRQSAFASSRILRQVAYEGSLSSHL